MEAVIPSPTPSTSVATSRGGRILCAVTSEPLDVGAILASAVGGGYGRATGLPPSPSPSPSAPPSSSAAPPVLPVRQGAAGALSSFVGITRDSFHGRIVARLEYEAHTPMALRQMVAVCEEADDGRAQPREHGHRAERPPCRGCDGGHEAHAHAEDVTEGGVASSPSPSALGAPAAPPSPSPLLLSACVWHRIGSVPPGEASIVIAVATAHRADGLDAVRYIIDEVKARAAIWKKELYVTPSSTRGGEGASAAPTTDIAGAWKVNAECEWGQAK
jgi:molybdopterin synthase catalytic subunit